MKSMFILFLLIIHCTAQMHVPTERIEAHRLLVVTVATQHTDGYKRFRQSTDRFALDVEVLGLQMDAKHDMTSANGGFKVRMLKDALHKYKDTENLIVLFSDSYDVIFNAGKEDILKAFFNHFTDARVVFSAEPYCWPDRSLATEYPLVKVGKRYLNSGLFMGYVDDLLHILQHHPIGDGDDDQLYYTRVYLDEDYRNKYAIQLDSVSFIFQNLHGVENDVHVWFDDAGEPVLLNEPYNTNPLIVHGNGNSKWRLNDLGNYLGGRYNIDKGCLTCRQDTLHVEESAYPSISMFLAVPVPTPYLHQFFQNIDQLHYPKDNIDLLVYNGIAEHHKVVNEWFKRKSTAYRSAKLIAPEQSMGVQGAYDYSVEFALDHHSDYLFHVESTAQLTMDKTLLTLIEINKPIIAPLLVRPESLFSNFWGALSNDGFYARSDDYKQIASRERLGEWYAPYISRVYLVHKSKLPAMQSANAYSFGSNLDADMAICAFWRNEQDLMFVDNMQEYGFIVNEDNFIVKDRLYPDLWAMFEGNRVLWEEQFLHPLYYDALTGDNLITQPCSDVFDFPFLSEKWCEQMIEELEHYGKWSGGGNKDERIAGGYENVPTRDIHFNQIAYDKQYFTALQDYVRPIQEKIYTGYYHNPIDINIMFVVRYRPDEQASLRPHHDASTYSIDLAMNLRGRDFEGGGVRFVRYNCSVLEHEVGWALIFPGRLTHLHEGLQVTKGTRYIGVAFINP